jgi:putative tryptophan/tyrosine transport system substrate-binding protein
VDRRTMLAAGIWSTAFSLRLRRLHAQTVSRVGIIINGGPGPFNDVFMRTFAQDLAVLGLAEGQIHVESHFANGVLDRLPGIARDLAAQGYDILIGLGGPASKAAQEATATTPVIFSIVTDPVALGLVQTLERPGGNVTGVTSLDRQQAPKQMELFKEVFPRLERIGILSDQTIPGADANGLAPIDRANAEAARDLGLQPIVVKIPRPTAERPVPDIEGTVASLASQGAQAVLVLELPIAFNHRHRIAEVAAQHRLPTMFPGGMGNAGGLITYGTNVADTWRRLPVFVTKIVAGAKPGDLPVEFVTRRELIINLKTVAQLDVQLPADLLARADQIIR